jgi:DNA-binding NarL/FixJ family response regulator
MDGRALRNVGSGIGVLAPTDLESRERVLIKLLNDGYTDGAIARKMGVSDRTIRRLNAQLMKKLGARSRFEAGVMATKMGLV